MTIICAMHDPKKKCTWIGADRFVSEGGICIPYIDNKWSCFGGWAVACAGNLRTVNLFQAHTKRLLDDLGGAFSFSLRLKEILVEDGFNHDTDWGPRGYGQSTILAHHSGVWSIGRYFEIIEIPSNNLWAEGSGRRLALGAGAALQDADAETVVCKAVDVAIRYDDGCGGEPWVHKIEAEK